MRPSAGITDASDYWPPHNQRGGLASLLGFERRAILSLGFCRARSVEDGCSAEKMPVSGVDITPKVFLGPLMGLVQELRLLFLLRPLIARSRGCRHRLALRRP